MTETDSETVPRSRRNVLAIAGAGLGVLGLSTSGSRAQTTTEGDGQAQVYTRAIIPRVGRPYRGEYVGQYIIFTDPTPDEAVSPAIVGECAFAEWAPSETRGYQGLLIDRLADEPRGVEIPMYLNGNKERVDVGNAAIIDRTSSCSDDFLGVQLEDVPVSRFEPDYDTEANPLVGEDPGPAGSPAAGEGTEGAGQPGFGVGTALAGLGTAALLKRVLGRSSD